MSDMHLTVPQLVMAWGRGWAVSRRTSPPEPVPGGFRVEVGLPGHRERHVLHTCTADELRRLADNQARPGRWIKISGTRDRLRKLLPSEWTIDSPGYLMTRTFTACRAEILGPYRPTITTDGDLVCAEAFADSGERVASARLGCAGQYGVIDQVETAPAHRRRGLGTALVRMLCDHASRHGTSTGILVATEDGRALYRHLGWSLHCEISGAFIREGGESGR